MKQNLKSHIIHPLVFTLFSAILLYGCYEKSEQKHDHSHEETDYKKNESLGENHSELDNKDLDHDEDEHEAGSAEIGEATLSPNSAKLIDLQMAIAQAKSFATELPLSGRITVARERTQQVVPKHGGVIVSIPVTLGSKVKSGDTLLVLRNPETMATYAEVASLAGTVIDQQASVGEMANGLVLIIADLTTVWLEIPVPERMSVGLKKGMRGSLITNTKMMESQTPIYIDYVSPMLDADTRTQMIRATLVNHSGKWKPGQMWKVILLGAESHSVLAVPSISVQTWNGKRMIFARETDTVFAALEIKIGKEMGGWIEVVSGLSQGDSVVTQGAFELKSKLATANMGDGHNH